MFQDLKKKVVVITGGSGFLGKQYCNAFLKNKSKVINLDIINKNKKVFFIMCDISKENDLIAAKKKYSKNSKKLISSSIMLQEIQYLMKRKNLINLKISN